MFRKAKRICLLALVFLAATLQAQAQNKKDEAVAATDNPAFVPMVKVGKAVENGDSILFVKMNNVYVFPNMTFKDKKQQAKYNRLVNNVKKVLPLAKQVKLMVIETYEYLQTLPDDQARQKHMKIVEKSIYKEYEPQMKKLTYSQGKLLIKLIHRECDSSSYEIVKSFFGSFRAGFYNAFASIFGASLKKEYDPDDTDRLTERVVLMVEAGQI